MRRKVYVTRRLPQPAIDMLEERFEVEVYPEDRAIPREVLMEKVKGIDALLPLLTDKVDAEVMDAAGENLKIIANYAVGYDNIDVDAATKRKIAVTNTPGVLTETTADMAWALMFAVARRVVEADKFTRAGKFKGWGPMMWTLLGFFLPLGQTVKMKLTSGSASASLAASSNQPARLILPHSTSGRPSRSPKPSPSTWLNSSRSTPL